MKKSVKRIVCSALSLLFAFTLVLERTVRFDANGETQDTTLLADASFKNVTGEFDTATLMESYFNSSVKESAEPTYETRTVMITLSKEHLVERAEGDVSSYLNSWSGDRAKAEIESEQKAFLKALSATGISYKLERTYNTVINAVAVELNTKHVSTIKKMKGVESVVITTAYAEPKTESGSGNGLPTNETSVYNTGIYNSDGYEAYGANTVVAILDTGLDYTHNAFQSFMSEDPVKAWDQAVVASKLAAADLRAEESSGGLEASDVYVSDKVPYAYDYADNDADVYPSYSNHGTHVAGIIGGYDPSGYTDKDGNAIHETFKGVAPDAQLAIFKVFTDDLNDPDLGGAVAEDIIAALEDCVKLNVDVVNMSLGTSCGFSTTDDGDSEGDMLNAVYQAVQDAGISLVCAASNDYSSAYGGVYGTNLATNPDSSTVGSPSTFAGALSVASINGQQANYMIANEGTDGQSYVFYEEARDIDGNPFEFADDITALYPDKKGSFEYVVIPGIGQVADYSSSIKALLKDSKGNSTGRIALIKRGDSTFEEKVRVAMSMGAAGVIVYNNVAGVIRMNLGEIENPVPAVSVSLNAGNALISAAVNRVGTVYIDADNKAGPFMSEFSSWGPTHDLKLKPEITAHGGEITSTVPGGYGEQSGTSMASPNMAGVVALVRNYIKQKDLASTEQEVNRLAMQLLMSTAESAKDQDGLPYSPRKQGAGLASLSKAIETKAYLWTDVAENDYRPKIELGDDPERTGVYTLNFKVTNFGGKELSFSPDYEFMTETLSADGKTVNEQAYMLNKMSTAVWSVEGGRYESDTITVAAGKTASISVKLSMNQKAKEYIDSSFANGMYVEGFLKLVSETDGQSDLSLPFLGFYGDWEVAPMLDYTAYEVAASEKDASVKDEDKIKASVWATLPYASYYNEKYIIPMGGYVYLLPDDEEPMYTDEAKSAVSRYNVYYGEGNAENYMSTTGIKAVYAGLLRNARVVKYKMYDTATGECLISDGVINRVSKAYSGGGSAVPGNVELELSPEEKMLVSNGTYRLEFEFYMNDPDKTDENGNLLYGVFEDDPSTPQIENINNVKGEFAFSFTVDYEAPVLQEARVRYYDYKDGKKEKQRIYLDLDVYDNHYAQSLMICYPKMDENGQLTLQLATDYPTPVRNATRNGVTTVSVEITDIYEKYGNQLYVQLDDYALNTCLYQLNIAEANANMLPDGDEFALAAGEENLSLNIYEAHKVSLVYSEAFGADANDSNFLWLSKNPTIAAVKNGEIVGLKAGTTEIVVSNGKDTSKTIKVNVSSTQATLVNVPSVSFGVIKNKFDALQKATGTVAVKSGQEFEFTIETDPWYHPMTGITFKWSSTNPEVASVDENGIVRTLKKGLTTITAVIVKDGKETLYAATVMLNVQNEFTASNYVLSEYNGVGYNALICPNCNEAWVESELVNVERNGVMNLYCCPDCYEDLDKLYTCEKSEDILKIPSDMNIMQIGAEAFKDNLNIKKLIIPSSVTEIGERAFLNCTALEEVYFVSTNHREDKEGNVNENVDWADLSIMLESAFEGCINLKKVDFSNVKKITVANRCFAGCTSLTELIDLQSVGTMGDYAFTGCTSLKGEKLDESGYVLDLSGLHVSGRYVFSGCNAVEDIETGRFTALGDYMFAGCTSIGAEKIITLRTPNIGVGAFANCKNMLGVKFEDPTAKGDLRFNIGANAFENCGKTGEFTIDFNDVKIRSIGNEAFKNSALSALNKLNLQYLEIFGGKVFSGSKITSFVLSDTLDAEKLTVLGIPFKGVSVQIAPGSSKYTIQNGVVYYKLGGSALMAVYANADWTGEISGQTTVIGAYAFADSKAASITIPSSVTKMGEGAFENAKASSIAFANGSKITEIPARAFYGAQNTKLLLPTSVTKIGDYAFANSWIKEVKGENVVKVGEGAFMDCPVISKLTTKAQADAIALGGDKEVVFGSYAFSGCVNLESATLLTTDMGMGVFMHASNLKEVTFVDGSTATGRYTFNGTSVEKVTLADSILTIDEQAFYGCHTLKEIDLANVKTVQAYAFMNCSTLSKATNIEKVTVFGNYAFYGTGLSGELDLSAAKEIGTFAFASENAAAQYTSVLIPNVEKIGDYAFLGGGEKQVTLPASVREIGNGAFMASDELESFEFAAENENFFVKDGVLFRYITEDSFALVSYPTARAQEANSENKRVYQVPDGTIAIQAYAFCNIKAKLDEVVLSHSVNTIGDSAFYASGIKEYTFESLEAPILEVVYRAEIEQTIQDLSTVAYYKGYYYANFNSYLFNFTHYIGEKSNLILNYPANGKGYDNHIYSLYFGTKNQTKLAMTDDMREFFALYEELLAQKPTLEYLLDQSSFTEEEKQLITAYSEQAERANILFGELIENAEQSTFLTAEVKDKTEEFGAFNRSLKAKIGEKTYVTKLKIHTDSTHRKVYKPGEEFDVTGLVIAAVYSDYSERKLSWSEMQLMTTGELTLDTEYVLIRYTGTEKDPSNTKNVQINLSIKVQEETIEVPPEEGNTETSAPELEKGNGADVKIVLIALGAVVAAVAITLLVVMAVQKKKRHVEKSAEHSDELRLQAVVLKHGDKNDSAQPKKRKTKNKK